MISCSARRPLVAGGPFVSLPKQWTASESGDQTQHCATLRQLASGEWWAFCDGKGAHGVLYRYGENRQLLGSHYIPSTDRLAMAESVSKKSSWVEYEGFVYVGTEDGRLLKLDQAGVIQDTHHFGNNVWVQQVALIGDELVVVASQYLAVKVVRLDTDLDVVKSVLIGNSLHEAEMSVFGDAVIVATDRGFLVEFDGALAEKHLWRLSPGAALGVPTVNGTSVWVGSAEGRLYHIQREGEFVSTIVGKSSITSAPVVTAAGVWVALDEEGLLKLVGSSYEVLREVRVPLSRTLLSFEAMAYHGHMLLGVASDRHYMLLSSEGETLLDLNAENVSQKLSATGKDLWLGEWVLSPSERMPAATVEKR